MYDDACYFLGIACVFRSYLHPLKTQYVAVACCCDSLLEIVDYYLFVNVAFFLCNKYKYMDDVQGEKNKILNSLRSTRLLDILHLFEAGIADAITSFK